MPSHFPIHRAAIVGGRDRGEGTEWESRPCPHTPEGGATYCVRREPAQDLQQGFVHLVRSPFVELPTASHK